MKFVQGFMIFLDELNKDLAIHDRMMMINICIDKLKEEAIDE